MTPRQLAVCLDLADWRMGRERALRLEAAAIGARGSPEDYTRRLSELSGE